MRIPAKLRFILVALAVGISAVTAQPPVVYSDGPYIRYDDDGIEIVRVVDGVPETGRLDPAAPFEVTSSDGRHRFEATLREAKTPPSYISQPERVTVLSDPHGDIDAFVSILISVGVMDEEYKWAYGDGHFVLLGDVFDRGPEVLPIFWLVYKLEGEAEEAGGAVHFLPGNHESMVLVGDLRYTMPKYTDLAEELGIGYEELWMRDWVLGEWLATRNFVLQTGRNVFTHAGLSEKLFSPGLWLDSLALNKVMRKFLHSDWKTREEYPMVELFFGMDGPLWYRGMVDRQNSNYSPIDEEGVTEVLANMDADRLFVGHTIHGEVCSFFDGRIVDVNVSNAENMREGRSRGVAIEGGRLFLLYDDPAKKREWNPAAEPNR